MPDPNQTITGTPFFLTIQKDGTIRNDFGSEVDNFVTLSGSRYAIPTRTTPIPSAMYMKADHFVMTGQLRGSVFGHPKRRDGSTQLTSPIVFMHLQDPSGQGPGYDLKPIRTLPDFKTLLCELTPAPGG